MLAKLVSQTSQYSIKFEMQSMMVCLKKMFNGKIIFHLKRRLKKLTISDRLDTITVKFRTEKKLRKFVSSTKHPFGGLKILCTKYRVEILLESLYFPEGK